MQCLLLQTQCGALFKPTGVGGGLSLEVAFGGLFCSSIGCYVTDFIKSRRHKVD